MISKDNYKNIIDRLDVENTFKYQPNGNKTYCNVFAQDVAKKYGTDDSPAFINGVLAKIA